MFPNFKLSNKFLHGTPKHVFAIQYVQNLNKCVLEKGKYAMICENSLCLVSMIFAYNCTISFSNYQYNPIAD